MNFRKANNIAGWVTGGIATLLYLFTMERTASFWDCGEFASVAYKMEVGHSPGAPLFMMLQRVFSLFAMGDKTLVAPMINSFSAIASGMTILFLFWTITHFGRKLVNREHSDVAGNVEPTGMQRVLIMGAAFVGSMAYTVCDTAWFSAVESEVYACSSFLTAIVFWAILKWEHVADQRGADRWLLLIMYLTGLSIGIHLLNLLTIPAIAMVYYFRRYTPTRRGTITAFLLGCVLLGLVQFGVIQGIPKLAVVFELWFVNEMGMPFDTGAIVFIVLLIAAVVAGLMYVRRKGYYLAHLGMLSLVFILIGLSSYMVPLLRSRADPPIDMTNPDNPISMLSYLQREQFGQQPLVYGPDFDSETMAGEGDDGKHYARKKDEEGNDVYAIVGLKQKLEFEPDKMRLFPRIWDNNDPGHRDFYARYLGLVSKNERGEEDRDQRTGRLLLEERPSAIDNISFFIRYQMGWMWWRYFMWNYSGRQNDFEGQGEAKNGNWVTGIKPIDKLRGLGDMDKMPDGYRNNGARNEYYLLPFILGIMGAVYQYQRRKRDFVVVTMLFFFTGIAIGIYLNMTPLQPRERDYAFAGSVYAFAIWIGLGVMMLHHWIASKVKGNAGVYAAIGLAFLLVPVIMLKDNWDDHDRSRKSLARATAFNSLASCEPNAILFTVGDNETYPLWYAQEIEGFRPDVRVVNTSLLGIDWYIDQLNYAVNESAPIPMMWKPDDYLGDRNAIAMVQPGDGQFQPLDKIVTDMNLPQVRREDGYGVLPTKTFSLPVPDRSYLQSKNLLPLNDTGAVTNVMNITIAKGTLQKNDLAELNIIAAIAKAGWTRPIYFSNLQEIGTFGNLKEYFKQEGTVYRLMPYMPVKPKLAPQEEGFIDVNKTFNLFMNTYTYGGGERNDVYFDEKNRQMFISYRATAARVADELTAAGRKADAIKVLDKVLNGITEHSYHYDFTAYLLAKSYWRAGDYAKAKMITQKIQANAEANANYLTSLGAGALRTHARDMQQDITSLADLSIHALRAGDQKLASDLTLRLNNITRDAAAKGDENITTLTVQILGMLAYDNIRTRDMEGFSAATNVISSLNAQALKGGNAALSQALTQMSGELANLQQQTMGIQPQPVQPAPAQPGQPAPAPAAQAPPAGNQPGGTPPAQPAGTR